MSNAWKSFVLVSKPWLHVIFEFFFYRGNGSVVESSTRLRCWGSSLSRDNIRQFHCNTLATKVNISQIFYKWDQKYRRVVSQVGRFGTLKTPHCSMAVLTKYRSKFKAFNRKRWRHRMNFNFKIHPMASTFPVFKNILRGVKTPTSKQANEWIWFTLEVNNCRQHLDLNLPLYFLDSVAM